MPAGIMVNICIQLAVGHQDIFIIIFQKIHYPDLAAFGSFVLIQLIFDFDKLAVAPEAVLEFRETAVRTGKAAVDIGNKKQVFFASCQEFRIVSFDKTFTDIHELALQYPNLIVFMQEIKKIRGDFTIIPAEYYPWRDILQAAGGIARQEIFQQNGLKIFYRFFKASGGFLQRFKGAGRILCGQRQQKIHGDKLQPVGFKWVGGKNLFQPFREIIRDFRKMKRVCRYQKCRQAEMLRDPIAAIILIFLRNFSKCCSNTFMLFPLIQWCTPKINQVLIKMEIGLVNYDFPVESLGYRVFS